MKPILFNTEMVKAILDGRKTVTRRLVKPSVLEHGTNWFWSPNENVCFAPYRIGDILYVRETWCDRWLPDGFLQGERRYGYKASFEPSYGYWGNDKQCKHNVWISSIHMPKDAARTFLKVTGVRVERLQDIEVQGAKEEGILSRCNNCSFYSEYCGSMAWVAINCRYKNPEEMVTEISSKWNTEHKKDIDHYGWDANPWVWVIEFERISKEDAYGA